MTVFQVHVSTCIIFLTGNNDYIIMLNMIALMGTAVDDRRHSEVVHLAQAISIRDLRIALSRSANTIHKNGLGYSFAPKQNMQRQLHTILAD